MCVVSTNTSDLSTVANDTDNVGICPEFEVATGFSCSEVSCDWAKSGLNNQSEHKNVDANLSNLPLATLEVECRVPKDAVFLVGAVVDSGLVETLRLEERLDDIEDLGEVALAIGTWSISTGKTGFQFVECCVGGLPTSGPSLCGCKLGVWRVEVKATGHKVCKSQ